MTAKPRLTVVTAETVDIYASHIALIKSRDWAAVHVSGDRNPPLDMADRRRTWR